MLVLVQLVWCVVSALVLVFVYELVLAPVLVSASLLVVLAKLVLCAALRAPFPPSGK